MENDSTKYYSKIIFKVIILAFILLGIFIAYKVAMFYVPFLIAILIATMIEPIIRFFMRKTKMKRKMASIISLILVVLIIGSLITLLVTALVSESKTLLANLNTSFSDAYRWAGNIINDLKDGRIQLPDGMLNTINDSLGGIIDSAKGIVYNVLTTVINTISSVPTMITYILITILAIVFICLDRDYVIGLAKKHFPKKWIAKAGEVVHQTCSISWNYIKAEAKLSGLCFILVTIGLIIFNICGLKVEYLAIMAILIGFVDLLPLFGAGAVMVPWTIYLYFTGNVPLAIAVLALWLVWAVIKQLIEPKFVSKQMGMHPIFTLFGMYTGFKIFGVLGLMLGPIILLIIKNVFNSLIEKGILKSFFEME